MAWFIPYLITKSSALVEVIPIVWYNVFLIGFKYKWIYAMNVVALFLILVSETMIADLELDEAQRTISLSLWK